MNNFIRNFLGSITPTVRGLLVLLTAGYAAGAVTQFMGGFSLQRWLGLSGWGLWHGQVWTLVTYPLLPAGFMDLLFALILLASLAPPLERAWSGAELLVFCLFSSAFAGLVCCVIQPGDSTLMTGPMVLSLAVLAAWMCLSGSTSVSFFGAGQASGMQAGLLIAAVSLGLTVFNGGWRAALVPLSGAAAGWLYVFARGKVRSRRSPEPAEAERISRLEL